MPANAGLNEVFEQMAGRRWLQSLWVEFRKQVELWADGYSLPEWAISVEMCTHTSALQRIVCLHWHAWVLSLPKKSASVSLMLNDFMFKEPLPHNSN